MGVTSYNFVSKMNNVTFLCQYLGQKLTFEKIYLHYWEDSNEDKMIILIDL